MKCDICGRYINEREKPFTVKAENEHGKVLEFKACMFCSRDVLRFMEGKRRGSCHGLASSKTLVSPNVL